MFSNTGVPKNENIDTSKFRVVNESIHSLLISDSIFLWSEDDSWVAAMKMLNILKLLFASALKAGFPLRGAVTLGEIWTGEVNLADVPNYHPNQLLFGKAFVNAYELELKQQWHGCIVEDNVYERLIEHFESLSTDEIGHMKSAHEKLSLVEFQQMLPVCRFIVPYKDGEVKEKYVIDWTFDRFEINFEANKYVRQSFSLYHPKSIKYWDVEIKIRNTTDFLLKRISEKTHISRQLFTS